MERDENIGITSTSTMHFNSHAHVERDKINYFVKNSFIISTHTLTWSVTITVIAFRTITLISTHTLTWSVTRLLLLMFLTNIFQLTRSRGA